MNVLAVHNYYRQAGGEDAVVAAEAELLRRHGHTVTEYAAHNTAIQGLSALAAGFRGLWNPRTYWDVRKLIRTQRPNVVHVHNTVPLISPSVYYAAASEGTPVVQTLHNYRLGCLNGLCLRNDRPCTDCVGRTFAWPGVRHACYRNSRSAASAVAAMLSIHRLAGTWRRHVHAYIAPTVFSRDLMIGAGLPAERVFVKPHFVDPDPGVGDTREDYALFVGRLSPEKGVITLLDAWRAVKSPLRLQIVGDGPLRTLVTERARTSTSVSWLGAQPPARLFEMMRRAACLVFPSDAYETFGRVIIEAFATGTPVVAAGHGAAAELVAHRRTGLCFRPGDPIDLAAAIDTFSGDAGLRRDMGHNARAEFEGRYTAAANYRLLLDIYGRAADECARPRADVPVRS